MQAEGNGDNIYVHLKAGRDVDGKPNSFDFNVPIPGEGELDARVLEGEGSLPPKIAHPPGLNWYHSHLHGLSSTQVMGGLSGLLSVGDDKANVKATCNKNTPPAECEKEIEDNTTYLKDHTDVRYVLLRDIPLRSIRALPEEANGAGAEWAPQERDFPHGTICAVWKKDASNGDNSENLRKGFCQRSKDSAWLFTLNGQRFPTITVEGGRNALLRIGNLSANVAYWLELYNELNNDDILRLTILGLDGVVPAKPVNPAQADKPIAAFEVPDLLLMPASRAEIYVRNDTRRHSDTQVYILKTKALDAGTDHWPEIQLARIVLKPNAVASEVEMALNAPVEQFPSLAVPEGPPEAAIAPPTRPKGCVRDLEKGEHRRVTFEGSPRSWRITTEIVRSNSTKSRPESEFEAAEDTKLASLPFEVYEHDGGIDWEGERHNHVCIGLDNDRSHKQLWVLVNNTGSLHNFHIHQMKFRLARAEELAEHKILPPDISHTCKDQPDPCPQPDYKFYDEASADSVGTEQTRWHDTIPIPPVSEAIEEPRVFLIMSFDAEQQIGRFVFHCHILKHEDKGLMAPIEVWDAR